MLPVLSVLSFVCLAAAEPHYNYNPPQGGSVAIHGVPVPVVAPPLPSFLAIKHDAQKAVRPSLPIHTGIIPVAQPLPSHFAIRDAQIPIKQTVETKPQPLKTSPFSSVFVPHPPFFAIRDVQIPRVPMAEEEIEEVDESVEDEDEPEILPVEPVALPVLPGILPPFIAAQHDAQTPIRADDKVSHIDIIYGPLVPNIRVPSVSITGELPVPGGASVAPSITAIRNQQVPIRGPLITIGEEDQAELEDVELVGADDRTPTSEESVRQEQRYVEIAYFPIKIANIFGTRELNPDNEVLAPAGIVQSTQPIFSWIPFINSKAHESIRSFANSKAHPDTHKGPNENSVAIIFR